MSKTISIIELLNKIANGEELPRKIKFEGKIYNLIPTINYFCEETKRWLTDILQSASLNNSLNFEVEIIEEQQDIDIQSIEKCDINITQSELVHNLIDIQDYINNVILNVVKQLDKNIKEK